MHAMVSRYRFTTMHLLLTCCAFQLASLTQNVRDRYSADTELLNRKALSL